MKRNFDRALAHVLRFEGGYVDHPSDPGGATNRGITRRTLAGWRKVSPWWHVPKSEVMVLGQRETSAIYFANYWSKSFCTKLPDGLDFYLFDFAVNSGPRRAVTSLQTIVGVTPDGHIGTKTMAAIRARDRATLIDQLDATRLKFLTRLSIFPTFGKGWTRRLTATRLAAHELIHLSPTQCKNAGA